MTYYELTLFVKSKKKPICTAIFESRQSLESFISSLTSDSEIVRLGTMIVAKSDFAYAEIKERTLKK